MGKVNRISPEVPVPVADVQSENFRLGEAANVVTNIHSLVSQANIIIIVGRDENYAAGIVIGKV